MTTLSESFDDDPIDGILGLAYPAISNLGQVYALFFTFTCSALLTYTSQKPFFNSAMEQGTVKEGVFGFRLADNGSELYLGGTNAEFYTGELEYHPVDKTTGFWQLENAEARVNGAAVVDGFDTIIDSGTTIMYGPPEAVKKVYEAVEGAGVFDEDYGYYYYPCDSPPEVSFSWGGRQWSITADK